MLFYARRNRVRLISPAQRICGVCFALFILLQTPLVTIPVRRDGRISDLPLSALEVAAIGVHLNYPDYVHAMQLVALPGAWWKMASKEIFACLSRDSSCAPRRLLDRQALLTATDTSDLLDPYEAAAGTASNLLAVSCGMLLACSVALPMVPDLTVSVVALAMFVWSVFQTACSPLPTIIFMSMLCMMAVFGNERQQTRPAASAAKNSGAAATKGSSAASTPGPAAGSSPRRGGGTKKRR